MAYWGAPGQIFFACGTPNKEGFTAQPFDFRPLARVRMVRLPTGVRDPTFLYGF